MSAAELTVDDLVPFADIDEAKAEAMIEDALGMAQLLAPCIFEEEFEHGAAAKAILRGAVLRWNEAGQGAVSQLTALGFGQSFDNRQPRRTMFTAPEIEQLQSMCHYREAGAYTVDTAPYEYPIHADVCALNLGATYCSCGAILTGVGPLWELPP